MNVKWTPELEDVIVEMYAAGETRVQNICEAVGISKVTFYEWKNTKETFRLKLEEAYKQRLSTMKDLAHTGLVTLLSGEKVTETTEEFRNIKETVTTEESFIGDDGKMHTIKTTKSEYKPIKVSQKQTVKHIRPNTAAVIFTLANLDPDNWKNRMQSDITTGGKSFFELMKESSAELEEAEEPKKKRRAPKKK